MQRLFIICLVSCVSSGLLSQTTLDTINYSSYPAMAKYEINAIKENFKNASNPLILTYLGSEWNDYFYFPFKDKEGNYYDFAYRNNNLCDIPFTDYDAPAEEWGKEPSKLVGKQFIITWEFELSYLVCCEGLQDSYPAMLPRISNIEYLGKSLATSD